MKPLNTKTLFFISLTTAVLFAACHDEKRETNVNSHSKHMDIVKSTRYISVNTWIDDFKSFRTAVYQKDVQKIKSYFNFPIPADTTHVWVAIYDKEDENKRPKEFPGTFNERDLEKQYDKLFDSVFVKSLLKVKSEQLYKTGEYTTPEINDGGQSYHMLANYNKATSTLQLSVLYAGGTDENGEEVSEGEYAVIYFFKVENNKTLKFDKILFAG